MYRKVLNAMSKPAARSAEISASIDLHGCTKGDAIDKLTQFLDEVTRSNRNGGDVWVQVITGSGAHSREGPVLRDEVKKLLQKRQMVFSLNSGKGSFTVKANSGKVLYPPPAPTDTKVVVQPRPERVPPLPQRNTRSNYNGSNNGSANAASRPTSTATSSMGTPSGTSSNSAALPPVMQASVDPIINSTLDPIRAEVAAIDKMHKENKEEQEFFEALKISAAAADKDEEDMLRQAMSLSKTDVGHSLVDDCHLQQVLERSKREFSERQEEEEAILESQLQEALERSTRESFVEEEHVSKELQEALELSKRASTKDDQRWMEVLEASARDYEDGELEDKELADSLEKALALSLKESKDSKPSA